MVWSDLGWLVSILFHFVVDFYVRWWDEMDCGGGVLCFRGVVEVMNIVGSLKCGGFFLFFFVV